MLFARIADAFYFLNNLFSINQIEIKITSYPLCTKNKQYLIYTLEYS